MKSNKPIKSIIYLLLMISNWASSNALAADIKPDELQQFIKDVQLNADLQISTMDKSANEGRVSWNQEMAKEPGQLSRDIVRTPLTIGDPNDANSIVITSDMLKGKTPKEIYDLEASKLVDYIKSENANLSDIDSEKIGKFWIGEILYAAAQTVPILASIKAQTDNGKLLQRWGGSSREDKTSVNITYSPKDNIITVAHSLTRKLKDQKFKINLFSKKLVITGATIFNIKTGEISWTFGYTIDDKKFEKKKNTLPQNAFDI